MRRILALLLTAAMLIAVLAGCGNNDGAGDSSTSPSSSPAASSSPGAPAGTASNAPNVPAGPAKISILNNMFGTFPADVDPNDNKWVNIFKEELPHIDIEWILAPDGAEYTEMLNLLMGSGDFPDVFWGGGVNGQWAEMGLLLEITDMHDRLYSNVYNFLTRDDLANTWYGGKQYGIKVINNGTQNPMLQYIRTDWLENLGMAMPKTLDELYDVLYAFTYGDPDGNGTDDTYGLCGGMQSYSFSHLWSIWCSFDVLPNYWTTVGNEIIPDVIRPETKKALEYLRKLWADGLIDKDTLVIPNQNEIEAKGTQGLIGVTGMASGGMAGRAYPNMVAGNPDARITELLPVPANGKIWLPLDRNGGKQYFITVACEYPEAVFELFNWAITQDTSREPLFALNADKIYLGEVGVNSRVVGDRFLLELPNADLTPEAAFDIYRFSYRFHFGTTSSLPNNLLIEAHRLLYEEGVAAGRNTHECQYTSKELTVRYGRLNEFVVGGPVMSELWSDLYTYWNEVSAGIIIGDLPLDDFDKWVSFFYSGGGQDIINEITALNK